MTRPTRFMDSTFNESTTQPEYTLNNTMTRSSRMRPHAPTRYVCIVSLLQLLGLLVVVENTPAVEAHCVYIDSLGCRNMSLALLERSNNTSSYTYDANDDTRSIEICSNLYEWQTRRRLLTVDDETYDTTAPEIPMTRKQLPSPGQQQPQNQQRALGCAFIFPANYTGPPFVCTFASGFEYTILDPYSRPWQQGDCPYPGQVSAPIITEITFEHRSDVRFYNDTYRESDPPTCSVRVDGVACLDCTPCPTGGYSVDCRNIGPHGRQVTCEGKAGAGIFFPLLATALPYYDDAVANSVSMSATVAPSPGVTTIAPSSTTPDDTAMTATPTNVVAATPVTNNETLTDETHSSSSSRLHQNSVVATVLVWLVGASLVWLQRL